MTLLALSVVLTAREPDIGRDESVSMFRWDAQTEKTVRQRLETLDLPLAYQGNEDKVVDHIRMYLINGRRETERMLGRAKVFFPIFEHNLQQAGLPEDLKYIPVIETGLNPHLRSSAGAHGMWQMTYAAAKFVDLRLTDAVDERYDVYKSTEGAVRMLQYLYSNFEDWSLVLAAYNAGPGKVKTAIKRANCPEYRFIERYLPRETQKYLVRYVAAAYVGKYYAAHGLQPSPTPASWRQVRVMPIGQYLNLYKVAEVAEVSYETLRKLNQGYKKGYLPHTSHTVNYLVLPAQGVERLTAYLAEKNGKAIGGKKEGQVLVQYVVSPGDNLNSVAKLFQVEPADIRKWNYLKDGRLQAHQQLSLFLPKDYLLNRA